MISVVQFQWAESACLISFDIPKLFEARPTSPPRHKVEYFYEKEYSYDIWLLINTVIDCIMFHPLGDLN